MSSTKRMIVFLLAFGVATVLFVHGISALGQAGKEERRTNTTKWQWSNDGETISVEVRGKAEFTDEYDDIKSVSEGGLVRIEEHRHGVWRRLEVTRALNGQLIRTYQVNGETLPIDDSGRRWVGEALLRAVRDGGVDVDKRVQTLLKQRGVSGVLDEIALMSSDYGKRIYFTALFKAENLSERDLQSALKAATTRVSSDYERATLLKSSAGKFLDSSDLTAEYFRSVATIKSDYEHRGVLSSLLKRQPLSEQVLSQMLESVARMPSDYEKATFLLEASSSYMSDARLRSAFLRAVETIKSDYERGRVLSVLLRNKQIG